jgi:hypothetical protein
MPNSDNLRRSGEYHREFSSKIDNKLGITEKTLNVDKFVNTK